LVLIDLLVNQARISLGTNPDAEIRSKLEKLRLGQRSIGARM
jgi:hypothetical protein